MNKSQTFPRRFSLLNWNFSRSFLHRQNDYEEEKNSFDTPFCSLIKVLLNSFSLAVCSFLSATSWGEGKREATEWEKLEAKKKITTLTRIINFCRAMPLVVSLEKCVGVLNTQPKKFWYVEFTCRTLWEIKIERKSLTIFFFIFSSLRHL